HPGHSNCPPASCRSTSASSLPTVSMGVSTRLAALPAAQPKDDREGLPLPDVLTLSSDTKKGNPIQLPSAMLRPDDARSKTTLTRSDAQQTGRTAPRTRPRPRR